MGDVGGGVCVGMCVGGCRRVNQRLLRMEVARREGGALSDCEDVREGERIG